MNDEFNKDNNQEENKEENTIKSPWEKQEESQESLFSDTIYSGEDETERSSEDKEDSLLPASDSEEKSSKKGWILTAIFLVVVVALIVSNKNESQEIIENEVDADKAAEVITEQPTTDGAYSLEINKQPAGDKIKVAALTFPKDGWVVVYTDNDNQPGNILSAYRFSAGDVTDWEMPLIVTLEANQKYHAVIFNDDGDKIFDHTKDTKVLDADSNLLYVTFNTQE